MNNKNIKSYEDACKVLNVAPITEEAVAAFPVEDRKSLLAYHKLTVIARALNGDWKPDWSNTSQRKYFPWFWFEGNAGLSSANAYYAASNTSADVGSRLCYHDDATARYAGNTFKELYEDFYCWDWENSPAASEPNQPTSDQPEAAKSTPERSEFLKKVVAASKELSGETEKHKGCALITMALDNNVGKDKDTDVAVSMTGKGSDVVALLTAFLTADGAQNVVHAAQKRVKAKELHGIIAELLNDEDEETEDNNEPENKE